MEITGTNPLTQEDKLERIIDVRGPEEQKAENERRKEKLKLICNAAKALHDLIQTAGVTNDYEINLSSDLAGNLNNPRIEQYTGSKGDKYRSEKARFYELVELGKTLGFILPNEFLATGRREALQNLSQLIHEIEQNLLPELGMEQLAEKVEEVLNNDQKEGKVASLKAA